MADRLTQLQDTVNQQAEYFCNSVGILQQYAAPSKLTGGSSGGFCTAAQTGQDGASTPQQDDYAQLFATLITRCARDIDALIDSLPADESSSDLQVQCLRRLELENQEAGERLEEVVKRGEALLEQVQASLADIAQSQLDMQGLVEARSPNNRNSYS